MAAKAQPSTSPQLSDATLEPAAIVAPIVAPVDVIRGRAATAGVASIGHTADEFSAAASAGRQLRPQLPQRLPPWRRAHHAYGIFHHHAFRLRRAFGKVQGKAATGNFPRESQ